MAGEWTPDTWVAVAASVVAVTATIPAYVSLRFARQAAEAAIEQTRLQRDIAREAALPRIWADVRPRPESPALLFLVVGNTGATTAHDVMVTITPRLVNDEDDGGDEGDTGDNGRIGGVQDAAAKGIAALPPGREYAWILGAGFAVIPSNRAATPHLLSIEATAPDGTRLTEAFMFRIDDMIKTWSGGGGSLAEVAEKVEGVKTELRAVRRALVPPPSKG